MFPLSNFPSTITTLPVTYNVPKTPSTYYIILWHWRLSSLKGFWLQLVSYTVGLPFNLVWVWPLGHINLQVSVLLSLCAKHRGKPCVGENIWWPPGVAFEASWVHSFGDLWGIFGSDIFSHPFEVFTKVPITYTQHKSQERIIVS